MKNKELKETVRKINNPCDDCGGSGVLPKENEIQQLRLACKTCNGKGYVEKLEIGCEVELYKDIGSNGHDYDVVTDIQYADEQGLILKRGYGELVEDKKFIVWGKHADITEDINCNLGKPLELQELLLALNKSDCVDFMDLKYGKLRIYTHEGKKIFIPLTLKISEYPDELSEKLIELLK